MAEDQHIIDFIISQYHTSPYESTPLAPAAGSYQDLEPTGCDYLPPTGADHQTLPWDISADQFRLYTSSLNLFSGEKTAGTDIFFEGSTADSFLSGKSPALLPTYEQPALMTTGQISSRMKRDAPPADMEMKEGVRADSGFDGSDQQGEEEDEQRHVGRGGGGKRQQAKNLDAERRRRKKLNDQLYALRALVPNISKMDRAAILGDAIEYVLKLQKEIKDLQDELEENTNPHGDIDDVAKQIGSSNNHNCQLEFSNPNIDSSLNSTRTTGPVAMNINNPTETMKHPRKHDGSTEEKEPQMEPHVEVRPVDGNRFFLEVLCEQKPGGFVRLMEAMSSLGLEITNINVTTFKPLVLNVFRVEKRDSEGVQAEHLRHSLLEVTRDANRGWQEKITDGVAEDLNHHRNQLH